MTYFIIFSLIIIAVFAWLAITATNEIIDYHNEK